MFLCADKKRPYTYGALMADFRKKLAAVGADVKLGPHGIRVRAYNDSRDANGEELTVAHGGWRSGAHSRYARFAQRAVLGIPAAMLGVVNPFTGTRQVSRSVLVRGTASQVEAPDEEEGEDHGSGAAATAPTVRPLAPEGYTRVQKESINGRKYATYLAPDGSVLSSAPHAWRHYLSGRSEAASAPPPTLSPRRPQGRRGAASSSNAHTSGISVSDLSEHTVERDRPSSRRAPATRQP